jgi:endosialidase-like protein
LSFLLAKSHSTSHDLFMKLTTLSTTYIRGLLGRSALFLISLLITCAAFPHTANAVNPPPDGGYPGGNTAEGQDALLSLTTGIYNAAVGLYSLRQNTAGSFNTAIGAGTLLVNTADDNTATGAGALLNNTTGTNNTATGEAALFFNTTGAFNTAVGTSVLLTNTTGNANTALGSDALSNNTTANNNTAIGEDALNSNTTGSGNTVVGFNSGFAVTTANNVICIGAGVAGANVNDSCYIGSIFGQTSSAGTAVFINSNGKLGTATSSRRFKEGIKPMDHTSEALFGLKPVTFHYKKEIDSAGTSQFGLVAEEVEKVNSDLVVRDKEGNPYSVRYDQVNAMLLNEFLKEHHKVQELEANAARQQKQVETLTAGLQKVSAQLEVSKLTPQVVLKNR